MSIKEYYVSIDSRHRDRTIWPSASRFEVKFDPPAGFTGATVQRSFKNILGIEVLHAIYPNTNNVLNQMYLNLHFPELDPLIETTHNGERCFAKLVPSQIVGPFIHSYQDTNERPIKRFPFRGVRVDKLTVELRDANGEVFDFGSDNSASSVPNPLVQTTLLLKVITDDEGRV